MKPTAKARLTSVKNAPLAFPTPIQVARYDGLADFNAELAKRILDLRQSAPGEVHSNVGGWHSDNQLLSRLGEPLGTKLAQMFVDNVLAAISSVAEMTEPPPPQFQMDAWAIVNERGHYNVPHIHPGCPWSGVYYVATQPGAGGEIVFTDPRTAALMSGHSLNPFKTLDNITIAPTPGMMLVFPAFLYHSVRAYDGEQPRVSVAFNLK